MGRKLFVLAMIFVFASFAAYAEDAPKKQENAAAKSTDMEISGKCMLVGTSNFPIVQFTTDDGAKYSLGGAYFDELKRLNNIKIQIRAKKAGNKQDYEHLDVLEFEILDVGKGVKPYFGTIEEKDGQLLLVVKDAGDPFILKSKNKAVMEKLSEGEGSRAWIAGDLNGKELKVKKWRILSK